MSYKANDKVNQLILIEETYHMDEHRKRKFWKCRCLRCGTVKEIREDQLKSQQTCGCLSRAFRSRWLYQKNKFTQK